MQILSTSSLNSPPGLARQAGTFPRPLWVTFPVAPRPLYGFPDVLWLPPDVFCAWEGCQCVSNNVQAVRQLGTYVTIIKYVTSCIRDISVNPILCLMTAISPFMQVMLQHNDGRICCEWAPSYQAMKWKDIQATWHMNKHSKDMQGYGWNAKLRIGTFPRPPRNQSAVAQFGGCLRPDS